MALNPQYEDIGKGFVAQYYAMFDNPVQRENVVNFYSVSNFLELFFLISESFFFCKEYVQSIFRHWQA